MQGEPENAPKYWAKATKALAAKDPVMAGIIASVGAQCLVSRGAPFETLLRSIVGQQISVKAAATIWGRVQVVIGEPTPEAVLAQSLEALRAAGLSARKVEYVQDLSHHFQAGTVNPAHWGSLADEALITELTQVKGIGRWTAEMVLMFNALRPDVFPIDDLAIQKAMRLNYGFSDSKEDKKRMVAHAEAWAPWRSVASWLLWRSLDLTPVGLTPIDSANY